MRAPLAFLLLLGLGAGASAGLGQTARGTTGNGASVPGAVPGPAQGSGGSAPEQVRSLSLPVSLSGSLPGVSAPAPVPRQDVALAAPAVAPLTPAPLGQEAPPVGAAGPVGAAALQAENTALREENSRLRRSLQEKSAFVSKAVHDLKNPLTPLEGYAEMLLSNPKEPPGPDQRRHGEAILRASKRLQVILNDLLDYMRAGSEAPLRRAPVDLGSLLSQAAESLAEAARRRGVTLRLELPKDKAVISGDTGLLQRLVENLASNGVKYNKEGGSLLLSVQPAPGGYALVFSDSGRGIAEDDLPRLFAPFFRSDQARDQPGTGLGLSSVKAAAERHGGRVEVESALGRGTTFRVFLPERPRD